jgi:2-methylfumaryl-CoA hydratase
MPTFPLPPQAELAGSVPFAREQARFPHYGRYLEDFVPGQVFVHPRGLTLNLGLVRAFAATFHQANPLYLNEPFAQAHGYRTTPAAPQLVFNVTLSLGVQNDSEKAIANLGYYRASFLGPVYPGDTLRALTKVMDRQDKGGGKPGIARVRTLSLNQHDQVVLQYERKILVAPRSARPETAPASGGDVPFPWVEAPALLLPDAPAAWPTGLTGEGTWLDSFRPGDVIVHANGRTLTDEHVPWTYAVGNTHPLHTDRVYSTGLSGAMSGEPIVYGGLVFAWLEGLGSRDVSENAWADLGFTEGYHTQPTVAGDTVAALHRVLSVEPVEGLPTPTAGLVTLQLIGVKNVSAAAALDQYGEALFVKETDKKDLGLEKLPSKIFEIERRLLVKARP